MLFIEFSFEFKSVLFLEHRVDTYLEGIWLEGMKSNLCSISSSLYASEVVVLSCIIYSCFYGELDSFEFSISPSPHVWIVKN